MLAADDDADTDVGVDDKMLLGSADGLPLPKNSDGKTLGTVVDVVTGDAVSVGIVVGA